MDRRQFLASSSALAFSGAISVGAAAPTILSQPWYDRVRRWGQINITDNNAADFDLAFWRRYWRETGTQGMLLNAGGATAFYPSKIPFHKVSPFLGNRDLFGELAQACREDGIVLLARLGYYSSKELRAAHPEWAVIDSQGKSLGTPCMNSGYTREYWPSIIREIATRYKPAGFSCSGWGANYDLCYCVTCQAMFRAKTGRELPRRIDWDDSNYRSWVEWNSDQVIALWDHQNAVTRRYGGPDCLWIGQLVASMAVRDSRRISERSKLIMLDHQFRTDGDSLAENSAMGKLFNGLTNWQRPVAEAQALYVGRLSSAAPVEAQAYIQAGIAGGLVPWWHTISAYQEDKRRYGIVGPVYSWHQKNEQYLFDRTPVAPIGVVWSEVNNVFHGRDELHERVIQPWEGMLNALTRARIPFVIVHADHIDRDASALKALVLPNLAAMTNDQVSAIQRFVVRGGGLLATGESSRCDRNGDLRSDFALADLLAAKAMPRTRVEAKQSGGIDVASAAKAYGARQGMKIPDWATSDMTYMRLAPELRRNVYGPGSSKEPPVPQGAKRHPALSGFDATDLLMLGGTIDGVAATTNATVLATFVPATPMLPPENAWMRVERTDVPALIVNEVAGQGRVAFLPCDLGRLYYRYNFPDHAALIANLVKWVIRENLPVFVEGPGLWDVNLFKQPGRLILHLNSLNAATWRPPVEEFPAIGPLKIRLRLEPGMAGDRARLLVSEQVLPVHIANGWAEVEVASIAANEVLVLS